MGETDHGLEQLTYGIRRIIVYYGEIKKIPSIYRKGIFLGDKELMKSIFHVENVKFYSRI